MSVSQPSLMELARTGDLRAIAYWINSFLAPQGIYVRVGVTRLGCLHLLVEFEQQPDRERLVRFICHRLSRLKSNVIGTVRIAARPLGTPQTAWTQSVRLLASSDLRPTRRQAPKRPQPAVLLEPDRPTPVSASRQPILSRSPCGIAQPKAHKVFRTARVKRNSSPIARIKHRYPVRPPNPAEARRRRQQSIAMGSAAVVAFTVGCSFEIFHRYRQAADIGQTSAFVERSNRPDIVTTADDRVTVSQKTTVDPSNPTVTLTFSGDSILSGSAPAQIDTLSQTAEPQADVALASLDDPLAAQAAAATLNSLTAGGVDVVNLASDRLTASGDGELVKTLDALQQAGIRPVGAGRNDREARRPEILDVKGQRIAYLGYSDSELHGAHSWGAGINPAVNDRIAADLQTIRNQVDWIVVNYQWSGDLAEYPGDQQVNLARFAIDHGADLVVGHHATVLQGAEIYKGRAIAYSLGNFISANAPTAPSDYNTAVLKVSLRGHQMRLEFLPVQVKESKPAIVLGEDAQQVLQYIQQASGLFEQPMQSPTVLDVRSGDTAPDAAPIAPETAPIPQSPAEAIAPTAPIAPDTAPTDPFTTPAAPADAAPFTTPAAPSSPATPFTTYPTPSSGAREINNATPQPNIETHDSFDRQDAPPTAQPVKFKEIKALPMGEAQPETLSPPAPQPYPQSQPDQPASIDTIAAAPQESILPPTSEAAPPSRSAAIVKTDVAESAPLPETSPNEIP